jgi:hypothetical protein
MKVELLPWRDRGFNRFYNVILTRADIIEIPEHYNVARVENSDIHFVLFPGTDMGKTFEICPPGLPEGFFSFLGTDHQGKDPKDWELSDLVRSVQTAYPTPIRAYGGHTGIKFDGMVVYSIEGERMTRSYAIYEFFKRRDDKKANLQQSLSPNRLCYQQSLQQ